MKVSLGFARLKNMKITQTALDRCGSERSGAVDRVSERRALRGSRGAEADHRQRPLFCALPSWGLTRVELPARDAWILQTVGHILTHMDESPVNESPR